ncbi:MAG: MFS transporter [Candidatus Helarchaeota archaeon]
MTEDIMAVEVRTRNKYVFSLGYLGSQLYNGIQASVTAWFWLNILKLNSLAYSIIMLIFYNIWNAVNDPIFGWISDRTNSKKWKGRRTPYIRIFTPIWCISTILLFFPFLSLDQIGLAIWLTIFLLLFDACYTMVAGCLNALLPELTTITTERTNISLICQIFSMIGVVSSFLFPVMFKNNVNVFFIFILIASIIAMTSLLIPGFYIKEKQIQIKEEPLGLKDALVESIKNRPFMAFCAYNFMQQFSTSIIMANVIFYATHVLKSSSTVAMLLFVALFVALLPGFLIWMRVGKLKGVKIAVFFSNLIIGIGLVVLFFADFVLAFIALAIVGFGLAGPLVFTNVMIAECTDWDELRTNRRREAMYFGTNALFTKPAIGLAQAVLAITLVSTGFIPDLIEPIWGNVINIPQNISAIWGIRMIMGLFPAIAIFVGLLILWLYPLDLKTTNEMKKKLAELHKNLNQ